MHTCHCICYGSLGEYCLDAQFSLRPSSNQIANGSIVTRARRPLVSGHGSAAGGVPAARQRGNLSGCVTDTVEGPHVAGGLDQVAQGAEHLETRERRNAVH